MQNKNKLTAAISNGMWSYIKNIKGNSIRTTLQGYGSCTPVNILQDFLNRLGDEEVGRISRECDLTQDDIL